jgi:hypothetical protein
MDQAVLVSSGQELVRVLDAAKIAPRLAMWVHATDTDTWKLWIVPPTDMKDKFEFYRRLAELISKNRAILGDLSASDVELASDEHPAIKGISRLLHAPGITAVNFSGNRFNGFYLPDSIILRSAIERRASPRASNVR